MSAPSAIDALGATCSRCGKLIRDHARGVQCKPPSEISQAAAILGRKGGSVTGKISPRKGEASAENGRKSKGRPRKTSKPPL